MNFTYRVAGALVGVAALTVSLAGCGVESSTTGHDPDAGRNTTQQGVTGSPARLDGEAKKAVLAAEVNSVDPQFPIADPGQFTSIVLGKVVDFRDGPVMEDYPGARDSLPWVVVKIEPTVVLQGSEKAGGPIYVQLTMSDRQGLEQALPAGTTTLVAVQPLDPSGDRYLADPWAGVPEGAVRYIAGAPYAAFADGPTATWFPVLGTTYQLPIQGLVPKSMKSQLPAELQK